MFLAHLTRRNWAIATYVVVAVVSVNCTARADVAEDDLVQLQGQWQLIQLKRNGSSVRFDAHLDVQVATIAGYRYSLGPLVPAEDAVLSLSANRWPKHIDMTLLSGPHLGRKVCGIYDVAGDTFVVAFGPPDGARPTDFSARGWGETSYLWMRVPPPGPLQAYPELLAPANGSGGR